MKRAITILLMITSLFLPLCAKGVRAYVSFNRIGLNDTLTLTIEGEDVNGELEILSPLKFNGFTIVGGPNSGTSISIVNGSMSKKETLSFVLAPTKTGTLTIPSLKVKAGKDVFTTEPIKVEVVKGSVVPHRRNRGNAFDPFSNFDDFFNDDFFSPPRPRKISLEDIFIRTEVSSKKVYVGEPVLVKFVLFTTVPITQLALKEVPSFQGFLAYDIDTNQRIRFNTTILGGKRYNTAVIYKKVLYPTKSGDLVIPPVSFVLNAQADFFFGKRVIRKSEPLRIRVLPLPPAPDGFSGLVGSFDIQASVDTTSARVGQSITLKVVVSGKGDLKSFDKILPDKLDGFRVFKPSSAEIKEKDPLHQTKVWNIVLVPVREGELRIPSVKLVYFDPLAEKYITKTTGGITVNVKGKVETGGVVVGQQPSGGTVTLLNRDITYIKTGRLDRVFYLVENKWVIIFVSVFPFVVLAFAFFIRVSDEKKKNNVEYRKTKAYSFFKQRLKEVRRLGKKKKAREFYQSLSKAIISYFSDKLSKPNIELRIDEIENILKEKGIDENLIKQLTDFVEYCDFESYTPHSSGVKLELIDEANEIIQKIERVL